MLASITPLGERGRGSTWGVTVAAFAIGATAGGLVIGAAAGGVGALALPAALATHARLAVLGAALALTAVLDARSGPAPGPRRQVNERWLDEYRGWVYGTGFGAQLGLGVTTVVTSAATYTCLLAALLTASPAAGGLIGACYGLVRGITPLAGARVRSPRDLLALHRAMARWQTLSRRIAVCALGAAAVASLAGGLA